MNNKGGDSMKTWEMIKRLTENPKKKFKSDLGEVEIFNGCLVWSSDMGDVIINNPTLNMNWEEVKESVSFIEAVKSGKRIKVVHGFTIDDELDCYMPLDDLLYELSNQYYANQMRNIILDGKWYIE